MKTKRLLASILAFAMILAAMSLTAFAAPGDLALSVDKNTASWGDTVTVTLPMPQSNTYKIGAISVTMSYDDTALEYINAYSDFFTVVENATEGNVYIDGFDMNCIKTQGNILVANFRVKGDAEGGNKLFDVTDISVESVINEQLYKTAADVTETNVDITAPVKLDTPVVTLTTDKKVDWEDVTNASTYHLVLKKGEAVIVEKDLTVSEFDFSAFVTETATYSAVVKANKSTAAYLESDPSDEVSQEYIVDSAITPTEKDYVTGSGDLEVVMSLNGNTFTGITELTENTDYTAAGNVVKIHDTVFAETETKIFTFTFDKGNAATLTVNVTKAADAATFVLAEREKENYTTDDTDANDGTNDGLIVVTNPGAPITNFLSATFKIENRADLGYEKVEYEVVPADGYALLYDANTDTYNINVKPVNGVAPAVSETTVGEGIVIGKLVRKGTGYGKGTITASNMVVTVEKSDNSYNILDVGSYDFLYDIPEPVEKLTVNVDFSKLPTETNNIADYQKMAVKLYSPRLGDITINLGSELAGYVGEKELKATVTREENKYQIVFENLPKFDGYTVAISGDGYRDAKAQFVLNEETTVNFWNNANDADSIYIEKVSGTEKVTRKNFLAGDIIMNNVIDLYDLSAVSSYFGKDRINENADLNAAYIQYDLNRDGKVDIIDITMLLAGWAE